MTQITEEVKIIAEGSESREVYLDENVTLEFIDQFQYTKKSDIQWRRKPFAPQVMPYVLIDTDENNYIDTPLKYFEKYFTDELYKKFAYHTNLYANQKHVNGFKPTNESEIRILFGLHMLMGCLKFSRIRMY